MMAILGVLRLIHLAAWICVVLTWWWKVLPPSPIWVYVLMALLPLDVYDVARAIGKGSWKRAAWEVAMALITVSMIIQLVG